MRFLIILSLSAFICNGILGDLRGCFLGHLPKTGRFFVILILKGRLHSTINFLESGKPNIAKI